jgi:hypothetical protein
MATSSIKQRIASRLKNKSIGEISFWLQIRMRQQINLRLKNKKVRNAAAWTSASMIGKSDFSGNNSKFISPGNKETHVVNLKNNGYTIMDNMVEPKVIDEILNYSQSLKCFDPFGADGLSECTIEEASKKSYTAHFKAADLLGNKTIMDIANDEGILNMAQDFLGAKPTISSVNMWWSFDGKEGAQEAQNFHRDIDDIKFCKLFVYLTDVTAETGPHIYVRGTSSSPKLREHKRYTDKEIEDTFGKENIVSFEHPKGTVFVVDTYGFHKGMPPRKGRRLLLQVEYSLHPIGYQDYHPIAINYENNYNKYANRLFFNFNGK